MPHHREHPYRQKYLLKDAAKSNMILVVRCNSCRRTINYLAIDLAEVYGGDVEAQNPPISCSKCKTDESISVKLRSPDMGDYGHLVVRRPVRIKVVRIWEDRKLGD